MGQRMRGGDLGFICWVGQTCPPDFSQSASRSVQNPDLHSYRTPMHIHTFLISHAPLPLSRGLSARLCFLTAAIAAMCTLFN
jgi:hypothetical protein